MIDVLGILAVPSGWIAILFVVSLMLFPFSGLRRLARHTLMASALIYGVFGLGPVAYALLGPLERAYPPVSDLSAMQDVDTIVVLTGHASRNAEMPPADLLNVSSIYRLMHAVWLMRGQPYSKTIISGSEESAEVMGEVALELGVSADRLQVDGNAPDTGHSAKRMRSKLEGERCALVTSAGHMPRAMGVFSRQGVECVPAPVEFYSTYALGFFDYLPSPRSLALSDLAIHEYLGLAWYRFRARI